ncbi:MAG: hypothetical protein Q9170_008052, partial [Blastenia crenularia]
RAEHPSYTYIFGRTDQFPFLVRVGADAPTAGTPFDINQWNIDFFFRVFECSVVAEDERGSVGASRAVEISYVVVIHHYNLLLLHISKCPQSIQPVASNRH